MGIGTVLIERGLVDAEQLRGAVDEQIRTGERLDHVLVRLGHVSATQILEAIGHQFAMPIVDLDAVEVKPAVLRALPARLVFKQRCVPLDEENGTLRVATSDPFELTAFDELSLLTGKTIDLVLADEQDIRKFIRQHYGVAGDTLDELSDGAEPDLDVEAAGDDPAAAAEEASVVKLVNDLLLEAVRERATDIHFEPYEDRLIIRYRIDGVLVQAGVPPTVNRFRHAIVSRLKIMASMNIAEKRTPQDGRISLRLDKAEYDLRVSVIPMLYGEGVVLRVLNKSAVMMTLDDLGMDPGLLGIWDRLIERPHGILLVTGPTGSGKSTTLYASLGRIIDDQTKAITVEDPVEYNVDGVNQIQVNRQVGLDFSAGLRAILRHDPDVIMIGEIRDLETAVAAVQASLTGHLVFSTLHTNDAAGAAPRLLDMGVEPFLVASSVEGVIAQRLVRTICPECGETVTPEDAHLPPDFGDVTGSTLRRGRGCRRCRASGYLGRIGIYELMEMTDPIREMVMERGNARKLAAHAVDVDGMVNLKAAGYEKVRRGRTTVEEVMRVARA
jgi:general secretion pathway protein E/type IV pilus assembly protein PilB